MADIPALYIVQNVGIEPLAGEEPSAYAVQNVGIEPLAGEEPSAYAVQNVGIEPLAGKEPSIYVAENTGDYDVADIGPSLGPEFAFAPILLKLTPNFGRESQSILAEGVGFGNEQAFVRWKGAGTGAAAYAEADVAATTSPWTVEGWFRAADVGAWGVVQGSITGSLLQLRATAVVKYEISLNAGKIKITNPAGGTSETLAAFDDGDMHHVRLVFNGTTLICLVDGIPELTLGATDVTWDRVRLANGLTADLREWRIKTETLTASIFNPVWDYTSDGTTFALWHIDEGTGTTLNDSSPNNRHLAIAGADYRWIDWDFALRVTLNGATQGLVSGDVRTRQAFWTVAVGAVSGPVVVKHISVHTDESAAAAFTVLPPVPLRGVGFEVRIYDRLNYANLLTILENAYGVAFSIELDAAGAGQFKLSLNDAKAIDANLAHGNLARIYLDGVERFAFFIENTQENLVVGDDVSGREVTISGSGLLNALDHMLVYPPNWPAASPSKWTFTDVTPGTILAAFLDAGVGRGVLSDLTYDFTAAVDSSGVAWPTLFTTEYEAGISVLMIIEQFVALGYNVKMDSDFSLHFYVTSGLDRSTGQAPTVFSEGDNLVVQKRSAVSSDVKNVALIKRQTSIFEAGVTSDFPRREMMVDARQTDDPTTAQFLATRTLEGVRQTDDAFTGEVTSLEGHAEVFVDWDLGDTVIVDVPDFIARQAFRIRALTCEQAGDYIRFTVSFNSVRHEFVARLKHLLDQLTGGGLIGNMGMGAGSPTILLGTIGGGVGTPLVVQEDDVTKVSAAATMDFLSADFDVTEAPSGEANIIIAAALMRDAEHTALGDGAPHHVKYLDVEAIAAVEGEPTLHLAGLVVFSQVASGVMPTTGAHLATKEYVDSAIHFIENYFFNDTASSYAGDYYKMLDTPTGEAESTFQSGLLGEGDDQALFNFATDAGAPGVTVLEAGVYTGHIHARVTLANKRPTKIHFEIYSRNNGVETLVVTSEETAFLTDSSAEYNLHAVLAADVTIATTDRLIIKWLANVDSAPASDVVVELFAEGTNASRFEVPVTTDVLNQIFLRQDGSRGGSISQAQDFGSLGIIADVIAEATPDAGITIDGLRIKDGFSEYDEIAIPGAPAVSKGRLFAAVLDNNDSLSPSTDLTALYYRRPDGLMVKLNDDFPYGTKMRHPQSATFPYGDSDEPPLLSSWTNFNYDYDVSSFTKDFLGCVWVQGLIKSGGIASQAFTLPEGYRNVGGVLRWVAIANAALGLIDVQAPGYVVPAAGSNAYFSLNRAAFPETNRITWHEVGGGGEPAFENSWVNFATGYDTPGFAKDAIGRVWIKGMVKSGVATTVFTLPAGYRPTKDIVMVSSSAPSLIAKLQVTSAGAVVATLLGAGTNAWYSINIVFTADGAATWREAGDPGEPAFENSWVNYGGVWDTAAFYKDACGIVHIKGFVKSGTIGQTVFTLPVGYRPKQGLIFPVIANDAIGVLVVEEDGRVRTSAGSNVWYSIHLSFVAEQ